MNSFCWNDTFDCVTFSDRSLFDKISSIKGNITADSNNKENIQNDEISLSTKPVKPENVSFNISLDDSIFLNDFLSPCKASIACTKTPLNNSVQSNEDLFINSPTKCVDDSAQFNKCPVNNVFLQSDTYNNNDKLPSKYYQKLFSNSPEKCSSKEADIKSNEDSIKSAVAEDVDRLSTIKGNSLNKICDNVDLSAWGLPRSILQKYKARGITSMFPWQAQCLQNTKLLGANSNLVYSAPTSAGKTLVAEILSIKTVLERQKKVLFILPFISVVREKMFYFQDILGSSGVRVEGFMGSHNPPGGFHAVNIAICTIEKANGIINRLLEENTLSEIGTVVIDEMHLLGDPGRGYLLELMLTKLLYMIARYDNINIQIIGMSATLPNLDLLGKWLKAELYITDFRPIPLYEQCLIGDEIYNKNLVSERYLSNISELETDTDHILKLCLETIENSCSVLIFCPTKAWCENLAQQIALAFWKLGCSKSPMGLVLRHQLNPELIKESLEQLRQCPVGLDNVLQKTISFGVAFHHAGLTMDERDIIEGAFRDGVLRVLVATSTLSSGVNLPARRVIIRTPTFHGKPLNSLVYRQMIGRAGRMGKDSCGESILICQKAEHRIAKELLLAELQPIESCLEGAGKLKRAILEVVASGVAETPEDVRLFTNCTLLAVSGNEAKDVLVSPIEEAVEFLHKNEFIRLQKQEDGSSKYVPTSLGKACLSSSMPPEEGLALFSELEKARQCFVLETELHLIYLVTPYSVCNQWINFDWMLFLELWEKLPESMKKVGELVGIRESYIISGSRNKIQTNTSKLYHKLQIHKRFFTALALQDLVNEVPLNQVASKFCCARGTLQSLQQSASTFAGMLTVFSRQLGWLTIEILVSQFQDRLQFGVNRDLLDLMRLPILNGPRARTIYNAGIETLAHLASSDVCTIENVLHKIGPFESEKERDGETKHEAQKRNEIRSIWITGKAGLTEREAAEMLIQDARRYLQLELGLLEAKWETHKTNTSHNDSAEISTEHEFQTEVSVETIIPENDFKNQEANISILNKTQSSYKTPKNLEDIHSNDKNSSADSNELHLSNSSNCDSSNSILSSHSNESPINLNLNTKTESVEENEISNMSDQSLFEQSFELHQQLAKCSISQENINTLETNSSTNQNSLHFENSDSGLDGSFLENAFASSFNLEPKMLENKSGIRMESKNLDPDQKVLSLNSFADELIVNSQNESESIVSPKAILEHTKLKRKYRIRTQIVNENYDTTIDESITLTPTKKRRISLIQKHKNHSLNSFVFQENESVFNLTYKSKISVPADLTKLHIVDVCKDVKVYHTFRSELFQKRIISMSLACVRVAESKPIIGQNVFHITEKRISEVEEFANKNRKVLGIILTWGDNIAYYISFENTVVTNSNKLEMLRKLFGTKSLTIRIFDCKEQVKALSVCCDLSFWTLIEDPKVADWLIEPDDIEKNLQALALKYSPEAVNLSRLAGNCKGFGSLGLDLNSAIEPRLRAAVEAIVTWQLCESLNDVLIEQSTKLFSTYQLEMKSILCLMRMECHGFGVDLNQLQGLADDLKDQSGNLQKEAYSLAGRHFSFASSTDVAKVLKMYKGRKVSTSKQVLEKQESPIASLILQWRKLNSTLTKMVYPLIRMVQNDRIYSCCITHNSTGRISMHEPNLQNVPKDFEVTNKVISCRKAFVPDKNNVFLSADYCQLELRLLAHFSQDSLLCSIMKSGEDVFKSVAAKWKNINETEVTDTDRQWAKQICYGIIYGMGAKALSEQLSVPEEDATKFMDSFRDRYPNIKMYIQETVGKCRDLGYVETLAGRRRYLPHINHQNSVLKSQAERQALNTTIQGSAADMAKLAMVLIENRFQEKFRRPTNVPKLVLHLHDELLYEVHEKYLLQTAKILKKCMEETVKLSVPFPVKLKSGLSWGRMTEMNL